MAAAAVAAVAAAVAAMAEATAVAVAVVLAAGDGPVDVLLGHLILRLPSAGWLLDAVSIEEFGQI